jgi:hypothetical protein
MTRDYELFRKWYVEPLRALEAMPEGQGGFIALATACFLYERYAVAALKAQRKKANLIAKVNQLTNDFNVDEETAWAFWNVIRDGLLHQAMPMQQQHGKTVPRWAFHHSYPLMALEDINGEVWLKVQPWKFVNKVLDFWISNLDLLQQSKGFPWGNIGSVPV